MALPEMAIDIDDATCAHHLLELPLDGAAVVVIELDCVAH